MKARNILGFLFLSSKLAYGTTGEDLTLEDWKENKKRIINEQIQLVEDTNTTHRVLIDESNRMLARLTETLEQLIFKNYTPTIDDWETIARGFSRVADRIVIEIENELYLLRWKNSKNILSYQECLRELDNNMMILGEISYLYKNSKKYYKAILKENRINPNDYTWVKFSDSYRIQDCEDFNRAPIAFRNYRTAQLHSEYTTYIGKLVTNEIERYTHLLRTEQKVSQKRRPGFEGYSITKRIKVTEAAAKTTPGEYYSPRAVSIFTVVKPK